MEIVLLIVLIAAAFIFGASRSSGPSKGRPGTSSSRTAAAPQQTAGGKQSVLQANESWLRERWHAAKAQPQQFPHWYWEEATDKQRARLAKEGVSIPSSCSKGQHSDVIGLFVDADPEDLDMLKFFGIALKGAQRNETRAKHEVAALNADPEKQRAWRSRPANPLHREFYRFLGERPPTGLTVEQAEARMRDADDALTEAQRDEWDAIENMVDEFEDREFRSDVEIRKPSPADIRAAIAALKADGKDADDPYELAEKLLAMKPTLARESAG